MDAAQTLVARHIPQPSREQLTQQLLLADQEMRRVGLTMVHDAGVTPEAIDVYREVIGSDRFTTRIYVMLTGLNTADWFIRGPLDRPAAPAGGACGETGRRWRAPSRGAALIEDYADEPGNRGLLVTAPDQLYMRSRVPHRTPVSRPPYTPLAIGRTAKCSAYSSVWSARFRVHATCACETSMRRSSMGTDIPRFARLSVSALIQPTHCTSDMPWAPHRLGNERIAEGACTPGERWWHPAPGWPNGSDFSRSNVRTRFWGSMPRLRARTLMGTRRADGRQTSGSRALKRCTA